MINDFSNIEIAGLSKLVLYENKGIIYNYPSISDISNVDNIANAGTIDTIEFCEGITFKREISLGNNYTSLKNDTINFFLKNFNSKNRATYNRLLQNRNGYICELTFLSGEVLVLNNAMFFNADLTKKLNENYVSLEGNYRVGSNKADLTKSVRDSFTEEWFATLTSYENNIVYGAAGIQNGKYLNSNCLETDGVTILEHASITASTTLLSNKGTATTTINFFDGGIEIYSGTMADFVLSNGSRYACSEGNGLVCYDVVNSNDLVVNKGFFDDSSYFEGVDSATKTAMIGLSDGVVEGFFSLVGESCVYSVLQKSPNQLMRVLVGHQFSNTSVGFFTLKAGAGTYELSIKNTILPRETFLDGNLHSYKITVSATPSIEVDGVVYSGADLNDIGIRIFTPDTTIDCLVVGVQKNWNGSSFTYAFYANGFLPSLLIKSLDELITYYSFESVGRTFSASATTKYNEGVGYVFDVWKFQDAAHYNQAFGFDLYESETVSGQFLRVPKKINGTSIAPTIAGYIYEKTIGGGNGFNDCETKFQLIEPIAQEIIDADIYAFFQTLGTANILTYADFLAYVQTNIAVIYSNNIINSVQLT